MKASVFSNQDAQDGRLVRTWLLAAMLAAVAAGVCAMLTLAPRVPYADQWRHYAHLLTLPFPANVFEFDNGHAEILPNLLRLLDLFSFGGHETLQILCAAALAMSATALFMRASRDPGTAPALRAAQLLVIALGVFWLGNLRALTQPGDGVHVYLVLTCLGAALCLTLDVSERDYAKALLASAFCVVASFSFGSGIATFVAVLAVLFVQRGPSRVWLIPAAALLAAGIAYAALAGPHGGDQHAILPAALTSVRVLGTPFVYVAWPLLDPAAAAAVPAPLDGLSIGIASAWTARFGAIRSAAFPQAAVGVAGIIWLLMILIRLWRTGHASRATRVGVGLASFGTAAAVLIALARQDYFAIHADQISAPRYVPWSSLFWAGLLLAQLGQPGSRRLLFVALLPLLLLPSELGMALLARHVREVAEDTALYAAVGVLPESASLGETAVEDVRAALPALRGARTAMYAWPEVEQLDRGAQIAVQDGPIDSTLTANRLGDEGRLVAATPIVLPCTVERPLAVEQSHVVGLLRRGADGRWHGVARGTGAPATVLRVAVACAHREQ